MKIFTFKLDFHGNKIQDYAKKDSCSHFQIEYRIFFYEQDNVNYDVRAISRYCP